MERDEMLIQLKERLELFTDDQLKALLKKTKEPTEQDIKDDITKHSKGIR